MASTDALGGPQSGVAVVLVRTSRDPSAKCRPRQNGDHEPGDSPCPVSLVNPSSTTNAGLLLSPQHLAESASALDGEARNLIEIAGKPQQFRRIHHQSIECSRRVHCSRCL